MTTGLRIVLSTCENRAQAEDIAHRLVERQLSACVNVLEGVHSIYRWQGAVESAEEILLLIKTNEARLEEVKELIAERHSYAVPECLVLEVAGGGDSYLAWLAASLS